ATATTDRTTHEPGQPGVRLRFYLDLRQELGPQDQTPDHPAAGSAEAPDG
ncbi:DUF6207 family protein, partial [Streptomyces pharetrae]